MPLGILYEGDETCLIGARNEAPLVIGLGEGEYFIASDIPPILPYTRNFIFMEDGEVALLSSKGVKVYDAKGEEVSKEPKYVDWNPLMAEKGGYKHFMLKEIFEQPRAVTDTIRGRLSEEKGDVVLDNVRLDREMLKRIHRIFLIACGTSYHAALVGKFLIEEFCRIPVEADIGSEFRYRNPIIGKNDLLVAHLPIWRDGRYPGCLERKQAERSNHPFHLQCGGIESGKGLGSCDLHPCRP